MLNFANRDCGKMEIRFLETMKMFLDAPWCNTSAVSVSGDTSYALKRGAKSVAFPNPIEASLKIEAQVLPFKAYALFSDGTIKTTGVVPFTETISATTTGTLTMKTTDSITGSISVYASDDDAFDKPIQVTVAGTSITGTFQSGTKYVVRGLQNKTNVKSISINNKSLPKDYYVTIETTDKGEDGSEVAKIITAYKATPKRNFEIALSSSGDPVTITFEFDCLEDKNGNQLDMTQM